MKKHISFTHFDYGLIAVIAILVIARFVVLPLTPPGFAADEATSGAHILSMITRGVDGSGQAWPLFAASLGGGYTTPIYLYPAVAWAMIFGAGELSLRMFSEFATLLAIGFIAAGMRLWLGNRAALLAAAIGLALPWGWLQGSIAWDPALVPLAVAISFYAFSQLIFTKNKRLKQSLLILLPVSLIALAYLYPPARVTAPILFLAAYSVLYAKKIIDVRGLIATVLGSIILVLPLLQFMTSPEAMVRSQSLIVFHKYSFFEGILQIIINFFQMLGPWFLFIDGDHNMRHSTGFQGMIGWAAIPAVIGFIAVIIKAVKTRKLNHALLIGIAVIGLSASLLGSAMTHEGQPHSLRAAAAWPFIVIILTFGWVWILSLKQKPIVYLSIALFTIGTVWYAVDLTTQFPSRAGDAFDKTAREKILRGEPIPYPELPVEYYRTR